MSDATDLISDMEGFIRSGRIPVRLALNADSDFEVSIQDLSTSIFHRRQGHATAVMRELVARADNSGVDLDLEAIPVDRNKSSDGLELSALVDFYRRFGFVGELEGGEESVWMSRMAVLQLSPPAPRQ